MNRTRETLTPGFDFLSTAQQIVLVARLRGDTLRAIGQQLGIALLAAKKMEDEALRKASPWRDARETRRKQMLREAQASAGQEYENEPD